MLKLKKKNEYAKLNLEKIQTGKGGADVSQEIVDFLVK
jgi:hypothetical protein